MAPFLYLVVKFQSLWSLLWNLICDSVFVTTPIHLLRASPRVFHILFSKIWCLSTPKLVWEEKKEIISKSFLYFYPKSFFSALFPTTRSHVLYQEPWICFCTRLSPSTRSFSLALFSPGTMSFFLFTRRAGKFRMRAPRPRAYMRARDRFLRGWKRWGERMSNYWREFFSHFAKKLMMGKPDDKLLEMLGTERRRYKAFISG
jgi:hypothetical protein